MKKLCMITILFFVSSAHAVCTFKLKNDTGTEIMTTSMDEGDQLDANKLPARTVVIKAGETKSVKVQYIYVKERTGVQGSAVTEFQRNPIPGRPAPVGLGYKWVFKKRFVILPPSKCPAESRIIYFSDIQNENQYKLGGLQITTVK